MVIPPYFRQKHKSACSLAVLRMVLASKNINISEEELIKKVEKDYGKNFKNLWNPTIAKLAREYGIDTTMYALWPLFKKENLKKALEEYLKSPQKFNHLKYENKNNKDALPEPLPLSYKDMFKAVNLGCKVVYGNLLPKKIKDLLSKGYLIQTSIHLEKLYPNKKPAFHSILIYDFTGDGIFYHDPDNGKSLSCSFRQLIGATMDVGAAIIYEI